jgi:hypothetical protein
MPLATMNCPELTALHLDREVVELLPERDTLSGLLNLNINVVVTNLVANAIAVQAATIGGTVVATVFQHAFSAT